MEQKSRKNISCPIILKKLSVESLSIKSQKELFFKKRKEERTIGGRPSSFMTLLPAQFNYTCTCTSMVNRIHLIPSLKI
jgi:hypothetical protein